MKRQTKSIGGSQLKIVDLFSGCGGMSLGFEKAGYEIVLAVDSWKSAVDIYNLNFSHEAVQFDLADFNSAIKEVVKYGPDLIIGGPPCQDFSSAGKRIERDRANLTHAFAKIISGVRPRAFVMENVERARLSNAYKRARKIYVEAGYSIAELVLDASFYGVPQVRKRFFCIGALGTDIEIIKSKLEDMASSERLTIRDYLGLEFGIERYYRHPRNYSRRAIYSIDEPSPAVRGVNRPVPPGYPGHHLDKGRVTKSLRSLSAIERARLQTFPKSFKLQGTKSDMELLVGNAVPVNLAYAVGRALKQSLEGTQIPFEAVLISDSA